jgi:predicted alpha/beta-fold hydrolase
VAAVDDPLVPISSFAGNEFAENDNVTLLTPKNGGHVAFVSAGDIYLSDMAKCFRSRASFYQAKQIAAT